MDVEQMLASAYAAMSERRLEDARGIFVKVLERDPNNVKSWIALGDIYRQADRRDLADRCNESALALSQNIVKARADGTGPNCRLCGGKTHYFDAMIVLVKYPVAYYKCENCGSVQTEEPYWLAEAYARPDVGDDWGICQRTLRLVIETCGLLDICGMDKSLNYLDYGGGNGLFTRMMRDNGYSFHSYDKYQTPFYSAQYSVKNLDDFSPDILTVFEVFEHLPYPPEIVNYIRRVNPQIVLFTTATYAGQDRSWVYFGPTHGQHVFFYSEVALRSIAQACDCIYLDTNHIKLLIKRELFEKLWAEDGSFARHRDIICSRSKLTEYCLEMFVADCRQKWSGG